LPKFAETRSVLPHPVVEDHPEWETLYWKAWELAFQHLMQPMPESGFVSNFIDPAFNGNTFQWDSCFMLMYAHYAEPQFHAIGTLDNFYAKQHEDGYICREINRETGKDYQLAASRTPSTRRCIRGSSGRTTFDRRQEPISRCAASSHQVLRLDPGSPPAENGLYWNTGLGSGEDDLVRNATAYSWVDMTSQQAQNAYFIARIAEQIGERQVKEYFDDENKALSKLVTGTMWDAKTGFYYDLKRDGTETGIKTILGFWPMMAHIASANRQLLWSSTCRTRRSSGVRTWFPRWLQTSRAIRPKASIGTARCGRRRITW